MSFASDSSAYNCFTSELAPESAVFLEAAVAVVVLGLAPTPIFDGAEAVVVVLGLAAPLAPAPPPTLPPPRI